MEGGERNIHDTVIMATLYSQMMMKEIKDESE
jgi:hypothetical protein